MGYLPGLPAAHTFSTQLQSAGQAGRSRADSSRR